MLQSYYELPTLAVGEPPKRNLVERCSRRPAPISNGCPETSEHLKLPRTLDLHTTTETKDEVEGRLLLDVVVRKSAAVLELLAGEDETLLIGGDALLVLDLGLDVVNGVRGLDIEGDGLAGQGLDEDLHATTETQDKVEGRLLLDVVVREGTAVLKLLTGEDQTLLVRRNSFLVLDLGLDIVNGVAGLDIKGDGLASKGLHENL